MSSSPVENVHRPASATAAVVAAIALGRKGRKTRAALPPEELSRIGKVSGRPRLPYCPCGAMTIERADARGHKWTAVT